MAYQVNSNSLTNTCGSAPFLAVEGLRFSYDKPQHVIECPVEYNGVLNDTEPNHSKFLLTLDWLQIHYKMDVLSSHFDDDGLWIKGKTKLKLLDNPTQHFLQLCEVWVWDRFLGMLQIEPRKGKSYTTGSASLKLDNRLFYESDCIWFDLLTHFENDTKAQFENITRLDIALDTPNRDVFDFVDRWVSFPQFSSVRKKGRARFSPIMTDVTNERSSFMTSFKIGMPKSSKTKLKKVLTCYDKSEELKNGKKPYIEEYFNANFGRTDGITRFEFRFASKAIKEYKINSHSSICFSTGVITDHHRLLRVSDLTSLENLSQIYKIALQNFFEFVPNHGDKNISRRPVVKLFDFEKLITEPLFASKREKGRDNGLHMAKILVRRMLTDFVIDNLTLKEQHNILGSCSVYIEFYGLDTWLSNNFGRWRTEWDKQLFLMDKSEPNYPSIIQFLLPDLDMDAIFGTVETAPF